MKNVSILGSTGSIGTQTLDVIRRNKDIKVVALAAGTRVKELAEQVREFRPSLVCIGTLKSYTVKQYYRPVYNRCCEYYAVKSIHNSTMSRN